MSSDGTRHAFIADGRLYLRAGGKTEEIESPFARANLEDYEKRKASHGWKSSGEAPGAGYAIWGQRGQSSAYTGFRFLTVVPAAENTLYYLITNGSVTGLFLYDLTSGSERRLFHKNDFFTHGLDVSPAGGELACAVAEEDGACNIALLSEEGRHRSTITGGDSRDSHPSYSREKTGRLYFQSAGIARDEGGNIMAYGAETICRLDPESGDLTEVLADPRYDFLQPRDDEAGNLYCIRRPYRGHGAGHPLHALGHALAFPFHFLSAVVGFLRTFTNLFGEKPRRIGAEFQPPARDKYVQVFGQAVNLAKIRLPKRPDEDPALVPAHYELVRLSPEGAIEVLAKNVVSFDLGASGRVQYTNGFRVLDLASPRPVFRHPVIESLRVLADTRA